MGLIGDTDDEHNGQARIPQGSTLVTDAPNAETLLQQMFGCHYQTQPTEYA